MLARGVERLAAAKQGGPYARRSPSNSNSVTWKRLWLEKIIPVGQAGRVMADYRVIFFNNLVNSYGKSFKCLQRAITVSSAKDAGEALEKAKREFERLEGVPNMDGFGRTLGKLVNQRYMLLVMCGRSTYKLTWEEIVALYRLTLDQPARNTQARYNVCPTTTIDTQSSAKSAAMPSCQCGGAWCPLGGRSRSRI
jgi:hypothetical protein